MSFKLPRIIRGISTYSTAEIQKQTAIISELQQQRQKALDHNEQEEVHRATATIEVAQLVLERMLEKAKH